MRFLPFIDVDEPFAKIFDFVNKLQSINILIACEESQTELKEFLSMGFNAFSCDVQVCSGGLPGRHIKCDVLDIINAPTKFITCDGKIHTIDKWHLVIAHPPCTFFSRAGANRLFINGNICEERYLKGLKARDFFFSCLNCNADYVVVENPVPLSIWELPSYDFKINPYDFGEPYAKSTCYWLGGKFEKLPFLIPTSMTVPHLSWVCASSRYKGINSNGKTRSKSFKGISEAMATQWGKFLIDKYIKV